MILPTFIQRLGLAAALAAPAAAADYVAVVIQPNNSYSIQYMRSSAGTVTVDSGGRQTPLKTYSDKVTVKGPGLAYVRLARGEFGNLSAYFRIEDEDRNEAVIKVEAAKGVANWTLTNDNKAPGISLEQANARVIIGKPKFK